MRRREGNTDEDEVHGCRMVYARQGVICVGISEGRRKEKGMRGGWTRQRRRQIHIGVTAHICTRRHIYAQEDTYGQKDGETTHAYAPGAQLAPQNHGTWVCVPKTLAHENHVERQEGKGREKDGK